MLPTVLQFSCSFLDEEINGEYFFTLEMWMLESLVQGLKKVKKFREFWSEETGMVILNSLLFGLLFICHSTREALEKYCLVPS